MSHLQILFSSQATKAWVAGLIAAIGGYLVPVVSDWLTNLTPDILSAWFADKLGVSIDYGLAAVAIGVLGTIWTYAVKNHPANRPADTVMQAKPFIK